MSGPAANLGADPVIRLRAILKRSCWIAGIAFALVVVAFTRERACGDHLNLLPSLAGRAGLAWLVALAYTAGYVWIALAYAVTVAVAGTVLPGAGDLRNVWGRTWPYAGILAVVALDYLPPAVLSAAAGLCGK